MRRDAKRQCRALRGAYVKCLAKGCREMVGTNWIGDDKVVLVYITAGSCELATRLARSLVEQRLAACANVLGPITSYYWWKEKLCEDSEAAVLVKTTVGRLEELVKTVKEIHEYEVPAITAVPVIGGNVDFLSWVAKEVSHAQEGECPGEGKS